MKRALFFILLFITLIPVTSQGKVVNIRAQGIALSIPGEFGSQLFYISDGQNLWQIYSYRKTFPSIKKGDYIEVSGEKSETRGLPRLKIKEAKQLKIIKNYPLPEPLIGEISKIKENFGKLVLLSGEIKQIEENFFLFQGKNSIELLSPGSSKKFQILKSVMITGVPIKIQNKMILVVFSEKNLSQDSAGEKQEKISSDLIRPEKELKFSNFAILIVALIIIIFLLNTLIKKRPF